jgi:UDP-N-acetylmuramoyl-tripeptide--D-alanyl-D-alanine ligase
LGTRVDCLVGAPGAHIAANVVGALAAIALVGGDVLNGAATLKDFTALKGRGDRFMAAGIAVIDESYNANPASMAAALALLGDAPGRKIAVLGSMLEMGEDGDVHHAGLIDPIRANKVDLVFAAGAEMAALWRQVPAALRGGFAGTADQLLPLLEKSLRPGDTVLVKGSNGARMSVVVAALKARRQARREKGGDL